MLITGTDYRILEQKPLSFISTVLVQLGQTPACDQGPDSVQDLVCISTSTVQRTGGKM